jgi:Rrf2 family cysteine metabolism transcriptional repressor
MFFTTKAEYGVRLLVALGRYGGEMPVSLKAVAEIEGLPMGYLEHIVALLRRAALVESVRGAHGGYRLARDPAVISMDEVLLALEGAVVPMDCFLAGSSEEARALQRVMCSHELDHGRTCATKLLWTRVQGGVTKALASTTLAELIAFSQRHGRDALPGAPAGADAGPLAAPSNDAASAAAGALAPRHLDEIRTGTGGGAARQSRTIEAAPRTRHAAA